MRLPSFGSLKKDSKTDILIIGGGIAGLLCAYFLERAGASCMLVEADRICGGVTQNTTAKITSQHGLIYDKLIRQFGREKAKMYLEANQAALMQYRQLAEQFPCDFSEQSNYVYALRDEKKLEQESRALEQLGFTAPLIKDLPLPVKTVGAVQFLHQAQFHPLKFLSGISSGLHVFEDTRVLEFQKDTVTTSGGKIKAEKIVIATHFPMLNKHGSYFLKLYQQRSYVLALEEASPPVDGMYVDEAENGLSFRTYQNLLLLGGGGHRTGKTGGGWRELEQFSQVHYPGAKETYRWATQDCMTLDGVPYIGQYSKRTPNLYVATGFNKWGMTSSMAAAMILCDMLTGKHNPYAPVFSPSRTVLRPQLAYNAFESVTNLLTPAKKRCPHLGCALKWNAQEHSWDCPCHGSRFSEDGKLLNNPATGGLKQK